MTERTSIFDGKTWLMLMDQHGAFLYAKTLKELTEKAGGGRVAKMYVDKKDGKTVQCGYIVGKRRFTAFLPVEVGDSEAE